jgi:two-component system sensor histidine kinase KdpD
VREAERRQLQRVLKLAQELGATPATLNDPEPAEALLRYARAHNLSRLVLGRQEGRGWGGLRWPGQRSLAERLSARADDIDVLQVALPAQVQAPARTAAEPEPATPWRWQGYAWALAVCALTTLLAAPLAQVLRETNVVMLYLAAVLGVALWQGRGPAVLAAFVGVGAFDFFFVEPRLSLAVRDAEYLITFALMLTVALVTGQLTAGLKAQALAADARERRMRALYEMSRDLSAALVPEQVAELGARFLRGEFQARSAVWALDARDRLLPLPGADITPDEGLARWAFDHTQAAGRGTDTLPASPHLVLPLKAPMRTRGVLALELARGLSPEERQLLDTCAALLALSLERIHYVEVAQASTVQIESERLRNALLSAISHDLRTPLAALVGLADTLHLTGATAQQGEIVDAMRQSASRMAAMVSNLLDMARLQSGAVQLNLQWLPLEEVIGSARAALGPALAGWPLTVRLPPDLPLLQLDAVLFERVLVNLLENAVKYTPRGTAIILSAAPDGEQQVQIAVEDRGPGLPARLRGADGHWALLFDKFQRGEREGSTPGVGLGLALCKAIVEAHGGSIAAESTSRGSIGAETPAVGGARFVIRLPRGNPPSTEGS